MLQTKKCFAIYRHRNIAFGTMLRLRSSQSLQVDSVQGARSRRKIRRSSDNLCDFYTSNGISGSITSSPDDDELYLIGAVDNSHTISFNLQICSRDGKIDDFVSLDSVREFKLKPVVQSCFAYTSVVKNGGEWLTIRRLRVATYELTPTDDVEMLTSSLDLEALSVVSHPKHCESVQHYQQHLNFTLIITSRLHSNHNITQSPSSTNFMRTVFEMVLIQSKTLQPNGCFLHYCVATSQLKSCKKELNVTEMVFLTKTFTLKIALSILMARRRLKGMHCLVRGTRYFEIYHS